MYVITCLLLHDYYLPESYYLYDIICRSIYYCKYIIIHLCYMIIIT